MKHQLAACLGLMISALLCGTARGQGQTPEFRGLWADAWRAGFKNLAEVRQLIADARSGRFNALIVQVRKRGDAYYNSRFEPRATDIAAGFDPLAALIREAHAATPPIEVHAWIVTFPIWSSESSIPSQPGHPLKAHPEWLMQDVSGATWDGSHYQLDPGHPAVQQHTFDVAMDIVSRYDVDGLHFDYVRYPGNTWGYNEAAINRFNARYQRSGQPAATESAWLTFRREQVTALVRRVYLNAAALKPWVKVSAATITWAPGITADAEWPGTAAYSSVLQDWRAWMQEGILDINMPMAYFHQESHADAWRRWSEFVKNHRYRRHAALGVGIYLNTVSNSIVQMRSTREPTGLGYRADGVVGYSHGVTSTDASRAEFMMALTQPSAFDAHAVPFFDDEVPPPDMPWKSAPDRGHIMGLVRHGLSGMTLDGASVRLTGSITKTLTSDATGFYGTPDLAAGRYSVTASFPGLLSNTGSVTLIAARVATLDVALFPPEGEAYVAGVRVSAGTRSAWVSWLSPTDLGTRVEYGPSTGLGLEAYSMGDPSTHHSVFLGGLLPDTSYSYQIVAETPSGERRAAVRNFRTAGTTILDNPAASYTAGWSLGTMAVDKYSNDYQYAGTVAGSATATATFVPQIPAPGYYDVYVWYSQGGNRSTNAAWEVVSDRGSVVKRINQSTGGGAWQLLARNQHLRPGAEGRVRLRNDTGETGRVVIADAVRWVYAQDQDPPPGERVPEWWAYHFFGASVPDTADPDSDQHSNYAEYVFGTDPARAASAPVLWIEARDSHSWAILFAPAQAGRLYTVEKRDAFTGPDQGWVALPAPPTIVNGVGMCLDTNTPGSVLQSFYRLQVQLGAK